MVNLGSLCFLTCLTLAQGPNTQPDTTRVEASSEVSKALGQGNYPWYDPKADAIRPIKPRVPNAASQATSSNSSSASPARSGSFGSLAFLGNFFAMIGFGIALAALVGVLVWFWKIYEPIDLDRNSRPRRQSAEPSRVESLPEGMEREFASSDPWNEAIRRRNRGDLAGAILCLFAHQLLTLSRLGLVRLAPGRTGRQLLKAVTDVEFRGMVHPTLRLFELVYYGHRNPTEEEFARVWTVAESFERRVAAGVMIH